MEHGQKTKRFALCGAIFPLAKVVRDRRGEKTRGGISGEGMERFYPRKRSQAALAILPVRSLMADATDFHLNTVTTLNVTPIEKSPRIVSLLVRFQLSITVVILP